MIETLALVPWRSAWPYLSATAAIGYLLGSVPFGLIFAWLAGAGDVRKLGSGNIGATNVLRTGNKLAAAATLICDAGKGAAAVLLARDHFNIELFAAVAGLGAILGHLFPVWLGFKGGKGVATFFGTLLAAAWPVGLAAGATWILMALVLRISSLAALTAVVLAPVYVMLFGRPWPVAALSVFMGVLIYIRHGPNIRRLLKGEEPRIGAKAPALAADPDALGHNGGPPLGGDDR